MAAVNSLHISFKGNSVFSDRVDIIRYNLFFKYILLSIVDENDKSLSSDEIEAKRKLANELNEKIKNGESIETLIAQYSEDYAEITDELTEDEKAVAEENNEKAVTEGIICDNTGVFNYTLYSVYNISVNAKIIEKLAELKVGESAVVETDNSIWVIAEYDINEKSEYYEDRKETIYQDLYSDDFNTKYTRWQAAMEYKFNEDILNELDPGNFNDLFSEIYDMEE